MKLLEPITIRGMEIKNRIVMAPMATNFEFSKGPQSRDYYLERVKGGVGAITTGTISIDAFFSERFTRGVREWVIEPIHEYGVKIGTELWQGNLIPTIPVKGVIQEWIAPSAGSPLGAKVLAGVKWAPSKCYCRELTVPEIQEIIARIARAAVKARETGFDYVEVHGAHGHNLGDQFFSPRDNRRTDAYGGSLQGRIRFSIELATAIREAIGDDFPFFWRHSAEHNLPGGHTLAESVEYAAELAKAGVDVIDVSFGHEEGYEAAPIRFMHPLLGCDESMGGWIPFAEEFKRRLSVPVIGVGRIHSLEVAEEVLSQGKVDMVAIGRQLLADPYWPQKITSGRSEDIRPCQCCNTCLDVFREERTAIRCVVNPWLGKEGEYEIKPAGKVKRVLVIGGGPAGMQAALEAAQKGHEVTLMEKSDRLGGNLLLTEVLPHKPTIRNLINYFIRQLDKAGVKVELNRAVDVNFVEEMKPDVVIVAAGATFSLPDIPGLQEDMVVMAADILSGRKQAGDKVAIIGGGLVACDTAELLASKGKKVIMLEVLPSIASELYPYQAHRVGYKLGAKGVIMMTGIALEEGTEKGLFVRNISGMEYPIEVDTIVIAAGARPDDGLVKQLEGKVPELYSIGDCVKPRRIINAIHEGASVGAKI
jgi:2,4-dienoyl-CoA reductase-like NADH-dependent reductase (Old Yellow Enzyme family)/thioredoxin reductase